MPTIRTSFSKIVVKGLRRAFKRGVDADVCYHSEGSGRAL